MSTVQQMDAEFSPFSGPFTEGGTTVQVMIHRARGSEDGWSLEILIDEENAVVWEETFETDQEAWNEFQEVVGENGLADVIGPAHEDED